MLYQPDECMNAPVLENFVSPHIVRLLCLVGLDQATTAYLWRAREGSPDTKLVTPFFDHDQYYKGIWKIMDDTEGGIIYLPAFQTLDMSKLLPDYTISKFNGSYTIMIDDVYKVESVSHSRLPDAFATMVYDCIKARVIDPDKAILLITLPENFL